MEIVEHGKNLDLAASSEDHAHGHHMSQEQHNHLLKFGWWAYIASEVMLFSSLIGTFLLAFRLYPEQQSELNIPLTTFNTFLLLTSSWTLVMALASIQEGDRKGLQRFLFMTFALGSIFVGIQAYEYVELSHHGLTLTSSTYGSAFYVLTGFHGAHVVGGVIWILRCFIKSLQGDFSQDDYIGIELVGLYWHFVDIVWIILFPLIYLF